MRALIVKLSALGDIVHAFPAVEEALARVEGLAIDWLVDARYKGLVALLGRVDTIRTPAGLQPSGALAPDLVIDVQGLVRSALLARRFDAPIVGALRVREWPAQLFYDRRITAPAALHAADVIRLVVAGALGYDAAPTWQRQHAQALKREGAKDVWLLHGTSQRAKLWPLDHWVELARGLIAQGLTPHLASGTAEEAGRAADIARQVPGTLCHDTPDFDAWHASFRTARLAISVDTGLGHLADWIGCPTLMLFQASDPARTGTQGGQSRSIWVGEAPKRPSRRWRDRPPQHAVVPVRLVLSAVDEALGR